MSKRLWYDISDERLICDLQRTLEIPQGSLERHDLDDLEHLRHKCREGGWLVEIRESSPETFAMEEIPGAVAIVISKERAMLFKGYGKHLTISSPTGQSCRIRTSEALHNFDPITMSRIETRRSQLRKRGVANRTIKQLEQKRGPQGADSITDWLSTRQELNASSVVSVAVHHPTLLPFDLGTDATCSAPWYEIRFTRMSQLDEKQSPWLAIMNIIRKETEMITLIIVLALLAMPLGFAMSMAVAFIIDFSPIAIESPDFIFYLMLALLVLNRTVMLVQQYISVRLSGRLSWRLTRIFVLRILNARIDSVRTLGDGDLYTRLNDLAAIQNLLVGKALSMFFSLATLIGGAVYLLYVGPYVVVPTLVACSVMVVFLFWFVPRLRNLSWAYLTTVSFYRNRVLERLEGRRVFKHIDSAGNLFARIDPYLARIAEFSHQRITLNKQLAVMSSVLGICFVGVVTWLVSTRYQNGAASLGSLTVVIGLTIKAFQNATQMMGILPQLVAIEPSVVRVQEVVKVTGPEPRPFMKHKRGQAHASVIVKDLCFSWTDNTPVLRGTSFELHAGTWTCLVGPSGCGKSTLSCVLGGLYEVESGAIELNGQSMQDYAPAVLRDQIALINQEPFLFNRTIRENITLGWTGVTKEQLESVLEVAGLTEFVARQPNGIDQPVGENGTQVSLGEKCRLCLARALLRSPGLVILDEALARLDGNTRKIVEEGLRISGITVLLLTHDLSQARHCDQVLVMENGRITEAGTFNELISRRNSFAETHALKQGFKPKKG